MGEAVVVAESVSAGSFFRLEACPARRLQMTSVPLVAVDDEWKMLRLKPDARCVSDREQPEGTKGGE